MKHLPFAFAFVGSALFALVACTAPEVEACEDFVSAAQACAEMNADPLSELDGLCEDVAAVCRELRLPLVPSPHGMLNPDALAHDKGKKRLAWWAFQRRDLSSAAAVCVTSGQEADDVRAAGCGRPIATHWTDGWTVPTG